MKWSGWTEEDQDGRWDERSKYISGDYTVEGLLICTMLLGVNYSIDYCWCAWSTLVQLVPRT